MFVHVPSRIFVFQVNCSSPRLNRNSNISLKRPASLPAGRELRGQKSSLGCCADSPLSSVTVPCHSCCGPFEANPLLQLSNRTAQLSTAQKPALTSVMGGCSSTRTQGLPMAFPPAPGPGMRPWVHLLVSLPSDLKEKRLGWGGVSGPTLPKAAGFLYHSAHVALISSLIKGRGSLARDPPAPGWCGCVQTPCSDLRRSVPKRLA